MILPVPLQAFSAALWTVWTWRTVRLPVLAHSGHRERGRKTNTMWKMAMQRMAQLSSGQEILQKVQTQSFYWFMEAASLQKCFQAREVKKFRREKQVQHNKGEIIQPYTTNIYRKRVGSGADHKIYDVHITTGQASGYRIGFQVRVQGRMSRQAEPQRVRGRHRGWTRCTCLPQGPHVLLRSWGLGESFGAKSWNTWRGGKVGGRRSIPVGERLLVRKGTVKAAFNFMAQHQVKAPQRHVSVSKQTDTVVKIPEELEL